MKRIICFLVAVLLVICGSFTCYATPSDDQFYYPDDPIQVVDGAGRRVSFPSAAMTVATSWGGGIDQYLLALGLSDKIAATNGKHALDKRFFDPNKMPKVGKWSLDQEALAEVLPDLYLHGAVIPEYLDEANFVGVRSYGMSFFTFDDVLKNLLDIGKMMGVQERATYVVEYCESILSLVDERVAQIPTSNRPRVIILGEKSGELASDLFNNIDSMISRAGGISCTPNEIANRTETTMVGLETIFEWNPDFIYLQDRECELSVDGIMNDPIWSPMNAVINEHVFCIPCDLDPWYKSDPACVLGTLYLSMTMYPELYTDIDLVNIAVAFYKEVYNIDITLDELGIIK